MFYGGIKKVFLSNGGKNPRPKGEKAIVGKSLKTSVSIFPPNFF